MRDLLCPECGAISICRNDDMLICKECGHVVFASEIRNRAKAAGDIIWKCEQCGSMFDDQIGFDLARKSWECQKCGHVKDLSDVYGNMKYNGDGAFDFILERVVPYFEREGIRYYYYDPENNVISLMHDTKAFAGVMQVDVHLESDSFLIIGWVPVITQKHKLNMVGEFVNRLNRLLKYGCFALDYDNGKIEYRYAIDFHNGEEGIENALDDGLKRVTTAVAKYGEYLGRILLGIYTPKKVVEALLERYSEEIEGNR